MKALNFNISASDAFNAGRDCGRNGVSDSNCHFKFFGSRELTSAWEAGKRAGETDRLRAAAPVEREGGE